MTAQPFIVRRQVVEHWAARRKRSVRSPGLDVCLAFDLDGLRALARELAVPIARLLDDPRSEPVTIVRAESKGQKRKDVDGHPVYHYRTVFADATEPGLSVYRTRLFALPEGRAPRLNEGHSAAELVVALTGRTLCFARHVQTGALIKDVLEEGDSIFVASHVPHAFRAAEGESEILAIDFPFETRAKRAPR